MKTALSLFITAALLLASVPSKAAVTAGSLEIWTDKTIAAAGEGFGLEAWANYEITEDAYYSGPPNLYLNIYKNGELLETYSECYFDVSLSYGIYTPQPGAAAGTIEYMAEAYDDYDGGYECAYRYIEVYDGGPLMCRVEIQEGYQHQENLRARSILLPQTVTVRFKANSASGNISLGGIRPCILGPDGSLDNNGGAFITNFGTDWSGVGYVERAVSIDRTGAWFFWTEAQDSSQAGTANYSQSPSGYAGYCLYFADNSFESRPVASVHIDGYQHGATIEAQPGQPPSVTVRFAAFDANADLIGIAPGIRAPDGSLNDEYHTLYPPQSSVGGVVERSVILDQSGTWCFTSYAADEYYDEFGIAAVNAYLVVEGYVDLAATGSNGVPVGLSQDSNNNGIPDLVEAGLGLDPSGTNSPIPSNIAREYHYNAVNEMTQSPERSYQLDAEGNIEGK
jgi:hypothetical protein